MTAAICAAPSGDVNAARARPPGGMGASEGGDRAGRSTGGEANPNNRRLCRPFLRHF